MLDICFGISVLNHLLIDIPFADPDQSHHALVLVSFDDVHSDLLPHDFCFQHLPCLLSMGLAWSADAPGTLIDFGHFRSVNSI